MGKICTDHNGKQFESIKEMCDYHGVNVSTYDGRLRSGYSLEVCLSNKPLPSGNNKSIADHNGKQFESIKEMCNYHGVSVSTYDGRLRLGYSLDVCLSNKPLPSGKNKPITDHNGKQFESVKAMCKYHNIKTSTYYERKNRGISLEESLKNATVNLSCTPCTDNEGKRFESKRAMCDYYDVNYYTYKSKIKDGYASEEFLTKKPRPKFESTPCTDHEGNQFESKRAMCDYHGVPYNIYHSRLKSGYSLEECLSKEPIQRTKGRVHTDSKSAEVTQRTKTKNKLYIDHKGNKFETVKAMCRFHGISKDIFRARCRAGLSLEECLASYKDTSHTDYEGRRFKSIQEMCIFYDINLETFLSRLNLGYSVNEILKYIIKIKQE